MRSLAILGALLLAPSVLSGCLDSSDQAAREYKDGFGFVQVWVNRPLDSDKFPPHQLFAVPRFVAFVAADNDTLLTVGGPGYTDMALGWSASWLESGPENDEWPAEAQRDWTQRSGIWYEGFVPAGNYSVVRVEIVDTWMRFATGAMPPVRVQGERLSVSPAEGEMFVVQEGKDLVLAFDSRIEQEGYGFVIR